MKVWIKSFDVGMGVKSKGVEFEVRSADDKDQLGDCYLTMTGLIWSKGKISKEKGTKVSWNDFITICESEASLKAAIKAAKSVTPYYLANPALNTDAAKAPRRLAPRWAPRREAVRNSTAYRAPSSGSTSRWIAVKYIAALAEKEI